MNIIAGLLIIIAFGIVGWWLLKDYFTGKIPTSGLLSGHEKRIAIVERTSIDGQRKLLLLRRDDVEHLIMTGGPIDVVVETGITRGQPQRISKRIRERGSDRGHVGESGDGEAVTFAPPRE